MLNPNTPLLEQVKNAILLRIDPFALIQPDNHQALRLFNGFYEGFPDIVIDLYGNTLLLFNYAEQPEQISDLIETLIGLCQELISGIQCVIIKTRFSPDPDQQKGVIHSGRPDPWIQENETRYALDLTMNQDASFYLDTRNLREWLHRNMQAKAVLNTFAYTGSLGIAAFAGGASRVVQTDLNRQFLNLAKASCALNDFPLIKNDFLTGDFYSVVKRFNRQNERFDCVILDPPFFSLSRGGKVDIQQGYNRLINKVRPLINDGGSLAAINNALFLSGADYFASLEELCSDGYLSIDRLVPVPIDMTGFPTTIFTKPPADPAPFNHPTKIAILKVRRKQE